MRVGLLSRLLSQWITSIVTGGESIFSLSPGAWQEEVCQSDASLPFIVNTVLVLDTGSWPMFRNLWPLKMTRKIGNTAGFCFDRNSFCLNEAFVSAHSSTEGLPVLYMLGSFCGLSPFYMVVIHHQESTELFCLTFCSSCSHF